MNDRLSALKLFARAARVGNFSSAGRELGLSQPSASRLIAAHEGKIGATLFSHTARAVTLTEAGATYLMRVEARPRCRRSQPLGFHGAVFRRLRRVPDVIAPPGELAANALSIDQVALNAT